MEFKFSDYLSDDLLKHFPVVILGALAFGIGGGLWGKGMYQEGSSIVFLAAIFFIVTAFWGCILGLLTKNLKNIFLLTGAGFLGGWVCLFVANLGGLIIMMLMGWLLLLTPPLFLILIYYFHNKNEKMISIVFLLLFIYVAFDWLLIILNKTTSTHFSAFSLHAFVYAIIGMIIGGIFGLIIGKPKIMAIFGVVGFSLGSYWIGILYHLFENTNEAVYGFEITYILVSIIAGAFLVAGLFYSPIISQDNSKNEVDAP